MMLCLYQKLLKRHAYNFADQNFFVGLIQWLVGENPVANLTLVDADLWQYLEPHEQAVVKLDQLLLQALSTRATTDPTATFKQILSLHQLATSKRA